MALLLNLVGELRAGPPVGPFDRTAHTAFEVSIDPFPQLHALGES